MTAQLKAVPPLDAAQPEQPEFRDAAIGWCETAAALAQALASALRSACDDRLPLLMAAVEHAGAVRQLEHALLQLFEDAMPEPPHGRPAVALYASRSPAP